MAMESQSTGKMEENPSGGLVRSSRPKVIIGLLSFVSGPALFFTQMVILSFECGSGRNPPPYGHCSGHALGLYVYGLPYVALSLVLGVAMLASASSAKSK